MCSCVIYLTFNHDCAQGKDIFFVSFTVHHNGLSRRQYCVSSSYLFHPFTVTCIFRSFSYLSRTPMRSSVSVVIGFVITVSYERFLLVYFPIGISCEYFSSVCFLSLSLEPSCVLWCDDKSVVTIPRRTVRNPARKTARNTALVTELVQSTKF